MLVISALMVLMILGSATTVANMLKARVTCPRRIVRASHQRERVGSMRAKGGSVGIEWAGSTRGGNMGVSTSTCSTPGGDRTPDLLVRRQDTSALTCQFHSIFLLMCARASGNPPLHAGIPELVAIMGLRRAVCQRSWLLPPETAKALDTIAFSA